MISYGTFYDTIFYITNLYSVDASIINDTTQLTLGVFLNKFNLVSYVPYSIFSLVSYVYFYILLFVFFCILLKKTANPLIAPMSEKELNSFDDLIVFSVFLVTLYFSYMFYLFGLIYVDSYTNLFFINFLFFALFCVLVLLGFLLTMGKYFIIFIKGAGNSLSLLNELIFDLVNIVSFNLRAFVQLIRIIIVYVSYIMLLMLYYEHYYITTDIFSNFVYIENITILNQLGAFVHLFFEIAHVLILFFMQIVAFSFMIF